MTLPIRDSYRVADRFLAGAYPGAGDPVEAVQRLRAFAEHGVTLFVDLTHPSDPLEPYARLLGAGARRVEHPIVDFGVPTTPCMTRILDELDGALAAGDSVYLHCWGGIGRTGTVVGCWLRRHELDQGDAVARIAALRRRASNASVGSPERPTQRAMVEAWKPGH